MQRGVNSMYEKLKVKAIYNDFIEKINLSDEQIKILDMLIDKKSIIQISLEMSMSQRTTNYEIKKIKQAYESYKNLELAKLLVLMN